MNEYRVITGKLVARTALHPGTGASVAVTDDLLRRDARGRYLLPGTAIGGALRAIATRLAPRLGGNIKICRALLRDDDVPPAEREKPCGCPVCHLFGDINPSEGDSEAEGGRASRLFIAHATAALPPAHSARIRDGVGIDRASRVAARAGRVKFDLEVLPPGTAFDLRLELEDASADDERLLAAALAEWQAGRAWLGGRVARGLGAFSLEQVRLTRWALETSADLIAFLQADEPWQAASGNAVTVDEGWLCQRLNEACATLPGAIHHNEAVARSFFTAQFDLCFDGLFLVNDQQAAARSGFDHAPLLAQMAQDGQPILPGAGLRGVLRAQAERIVRTLATLANEGEDFLKKCPACNPVEARAKQPLANCDSLIRTKRRRENKDDSDEVDEPELCLACWLFGSTRRGSRFIVEDAAALATARKPLDFIAIDRFTGGVKGNAKFDAFALWQPVFRVRCHLDNPVAWELGWLALVLRDLHDGLLPVGFGGAKGFGRAHVEALTADYGFIADDDLADAAELAQTVEQPASGIYRVLHWGTQDAAQRTQLLALAENWVAAFREKCATFERADELKLRSDSYFRGNLPELYTKPDFTTEDYQWLQQA